MELFTGLLPDLSPGQWLATLSSWTRLAGVFLSVPFFGSRVLPFRFRMALACLLLVCLPATSPYLRPPVEASGNAVRAESPGSGAVGGLGAEDPPPPPGAPRIHLLTLGCELLVGFSLGWFAMVVLAAFRSAAVLVSDQIGFSLGGVLDPLSQGGEHVLRAFYGLFAVFVFVSVDMHHEFLRGFSESFQVLPAGTFLESGLGDLLQRLVLLGGWHLFELTLRVALPVLAMLLLASVVQGILARIIPELEFLVFGFPLRTFAGLGVCVLSLPWLAALLRGLFSGACDQGRSLVRTLAG